jgi:excisionase family DNA binding protein
VSERLLSVDDVHALTGISTHAIRRAIKRGELAGSKVANCVRVRESDYDAWIDAGRIEPPARAAPARPRARRASTRDAGAASVARLKAIEGGHA